MAKTITLSLLDWSTVNQLNPRNSCADETSPDCPCSETNRKGGAGKSEIGKEESWLLSETKKTKAAVGRPDLPRHENQAETTHVESILIPCLDEGSIPSSSTKCSGHLPDDTRQNQDNLQLIGRRQDKPRNISILRGFWACAYIQSFFSAGGCFLFLADLGRTLTI